MKLHHVIDLNANTTWNSPSGPIGPDFYESYYGMQPVGSTHPPSIKDPIKVSPRLAQDGWKKGDSKESRAQAIADLLEIHKRMLRQPGRPAISQGATYPVFPDYVTRT